VDVETTPQCVQFKHELEPQSQLCLNFKTMLLVNNNSSSNSASVSMNGAGVGGRLQAVFRIYQIHMFLGLPGSGSISKRYGSGSLYHQVKIVRKTLESYSFVTSFGLFIFEK
jgi:hypothetical protein